MKKLLSVLSAFVITSSTAASLVSCGNSTPHEDPTPEMNKQAITWLSGALPEIVRNLKSKILSAYYSVGDNTKPDFKTDYQEFFKDFPKYGEVTSEQLLDLQKAGNQAAATDIFAAMDRGLKSVNTEIFSKLDKNNHSKCSSYIDSNNSQILSVDRNQSTISLEKYNYNPTKSEEKDIDQIEPDLSFEDYQKQYTELAKKGPITDAYKIKVNLTLQVTYHVNQTPESTSITVTDSTNSFDSILVDKDGISLFEMFANRTINSINGKLKDSCFAIDVKNNPNFTYEQDQADLKTKLIDVINKYFSNDSGNKSLSVTVSNIETTFGGEWGDFDDNQNVLMNPDEAYINKITNAGDLSATMKMVTPKSANDIDSASKDYFTGNETKFNDNLAGNIKSYKKEQSPSSYQNKNINKNNLVNEKNSFSWNDENYTKIASKTVSYGTIQITNWASGSTPLDSSYIIPWFAFNSDISAARETYFDSKIQTLKTIFSTPDQSTSFFNYFNIYNFSASFDGSAWYKWASSVGLVWLLEKIGIKMSILKDLTIPNMGASVLQGVDKDMSTFKNNNYLYSTSYNTIFSNYLKNLQTSGTQIDDTDFSYSLTPSNLSVDNVSWKEPSFMKSGIEGGALAYISSWITNGIGSSVDPKRPNPYTTNTNPDRSKGDYEIYSSSSLFSSVEQLTTMFNEISNIDFKDPKSIFKTFSACAPKFNLLFDGLTINFDPGVIFNFALSYSEQQSIPYSTK